MAEKERVYKEGEYSELEILKKKQEWEIKFLGKYLWNLILRVY